MTLLHSTALDFKRGYDDDFWFATVGGEDTTAPVITFVSQTRAKISRVVGSDATDIVWSSGENFTEYQLRVVPANTSIVSQGTLIEQNQNPAAGGTASIQYTSTITDDELVAASAAEGTNIIKIFAKDSSGNWST